MINKKLIAFGILSVCLFASCSNLELDLDEQGEIVFNSHISNLQSRVNGNQWEDNDEIGIFMSTASGSTTNKKFLAKSDGTLTPTPGNALFIQPKETANFFAYYPYHASLLSQVVPISIADQSHPSKIDFLYSNNARNIKAGETVNLQFDHQLSMLSVQVSADETIDNLKDLSVKITGMNTIASFDLGSGILTTNNSQADIQMRINAEGTLAEAIVLPTTSLNNLKMVFTLDDISFEWPITIQGGTAIEPGCKYTFNATLSVKAGSPVIQSNSPGISNWTDKTGGNISVIFGPDKKPGTNPEEGGNTDPEAGTDPETPDPETPETPDPIVPGTGITLLEETCGNPGDSKPTINKYHGWSDSHGLTYTDPTGYNYACIRTTSTLNGHIWFPFEKNSALKISGFSTASYQSVQLTYDLASNHGNSTAPNQNILMVSTDKGPLTVPAKTMGKSDTYQRITLTLPTGFTYLQFTSNATTNKAGFRLDNIKVVGIK